jgi:hypothetical protein
MTGITSTTLADGRELIYFDDAATPKHRTAETTTDHRDLPARGEPGEVRFDALTGEWVAVAAHRQTRTHLPPADQCPICPTTQNNPSETTTLWSLKTGSRHSAPRWARCRRIRHGEPQAPPTGGVR